MEAFTASYRGGEGPPLVCLHGFIDSWRTWELVLPRLERSHTVLAPALPGHAGGPPLGSEPGEPALVEGIERAMDEAGWDTAHVVGNSLGGYVSLQLAARGRARSVVAFAPAGGWEDGDPILEERFAYFTSTLELARVAAPYADQAVSSPEGRRRATLYTAVNFEHIPADLLAHQIRGVAACQGAEALMDLARRAGYPVDLERIECPVRVIWGKEDKILPWPRAAVRYREGLPWAEWVELPGVGHCPQLDVPIEAAELILGFTSDRRSAKADKEPA
jgi:pimeloyl-ACP methyl ester carboxylesterase